MTRKIKIPIEKVETLCGSRIRIKYHLTLDKVKKLLTKQDKLPFEFLSSPADALER